MTTATLPSYYSGDTVRFTATFRDYPLDTETEGALFNPETVTVTIFDTDFTVVETATGVNDSPGVYTFDYTVPSEPGSYYIEWKGLVNGKPEIKRDKFKVKFYVRS